MSPKDELPDDDDVIIWHLEDMAGLDAYRVTKGSTVLGEFTGRSIGSTVFQAAVEHTEPGRAVWLKDDRQFRRLNPTPLWTPETGTDTRFRDGPVRGLWAL
jgi:hypothetical protein